VIDHRCPSFVIVIGPTIKVLGAYNISESLR
jgi:hypothetical protein